MTVHTCPVAWHTDVNGKLHDIVHARKPSALDGALVKGTEKSLLPASALPVEADDVLYMFPKVRASAWMRRRANPRAPKAGPGRQREGVATQHTQSWSPLRSHKWRTPLAMHVQMFERQVEVLVFVASAPAVPGRVHDLSSSSKLDFHVSYIGETRGRAACFRDRDARAGWAARDGLGDGARRRRGGGTRRGG